MSVVFEEVGKTRTLTFEDVEDFLVRFVDDGWWTKMGQRMQAKKKTELTAELQVFGGFYDFMVKEATKAGYNNVPYSEFHRDGDVFRVLVFQHVFLGFGTLGVLLLHPFMRFYIKFDDALTPHPHSHTLITESLHDFPKVFNTIPPANIIKSNHFNKKSKGGKHGFVFKAATTPSTAQGSPSGSNDAGSPGGEGGVGHDEGGSPAIGREGGSPAEGHEGGSPAEGRDGGSPADGREGGSPAGGSLGGEEHYGWDIGGGDDYRSPSPMVVVEEAAPVVVYDALAQAAAASRVDALLMAARPRPTLGVGLLSPQSPSLVSSLCGLRFEVLNLMMVYGEPSVRSLLKATCAELTRRRHAAAASADGTSAAGTPGLFLSCLHGADHVLVGRALTVLESVALELPSLFQQRVADLGVQLRDAADTRRGLPVAVVVQELMALLCVVPETPHLQLFVPELIGGFTSCAKFDGARALVDAALAPRRAEEGRAAEAAVAEERRVRQVAAAAAAASDAAFAARAAARMGRAPQRDLGGPPRPGRMRRLGVPIAFVLNAAFLPPLRMQPVR